MSWDSYQREETPVLEEGGYRVVITEVEKTVSKTSGRNMLIVHMKTCFSNAIIKAYIVDNEWKNKNLTKLFDSFTEIEEGNMNTLSWIGAMGAIKTTLNDKGYPEFKFFLNARQAKDLPEWEGARPERNIVSNGFVGIESEDEDLPF